MILMTIQGNTAGWRLRLSPNLLPQLCSVKKGKYIQYSRFSTLSLGTKSFGESTCSIMWYCPKVVTPVRTRTGVLKTATLYNRAAHVAMDGSLLFFSFLWWEIFHSLRKRSAVPIPTERIANFGDHLTFSSPTTFDDWQDKCSTPKSKLWKTAR